MVVTNEVPPRPSPEELDAVLTRYRRGAWSAPLPPLLSNEPAAPGVIPAAYRPLVGHLADRLRAHDVLDQLVRPPGGPAFASARELAGSPRTRRSALRVWLERTRPSHARGDRRVLLEASAAGVRDDAVFEASTARDAQAVVAAFDEEVDWRAHQGGVPRLESPAPIYGWSPLAFDPWDLLHQALERGATPAVRRLRLEAHRCAEPSRDVVLLRPGPDRLGPGARLGWSLFEDLVAQEWRLIARRLVGVRESLRHFQDDVAAAIDSRSGVRVRTLARHALAPDLTWDPFAGVRALVSVEDTPWALKAEVTRRYVHDAPWNALRGVCRAWRASLFAPGRRAYDHGVPLSDDLFEALLQARPLAVALDRAGLSDPESAA